MAPPTPPELATDYPRRHPNPITKAISLSHVRFERPDLDAAESFLVDFGLVVAARSADRVWLRAADRSPYCCVIERAPTARFVGLGFRVATREALEALSRRPEASGIEPAEGPGGGERVRLIDPNGFVVDALFGQTDAEPLRHRRPLPMNTPEDHPRVNGTQRPPMAPPEVTKLGHFVVEVPRFQSQCEWYSECFGLIPSDVQVIPDGSPVVVFMRLDLGDAPADHHTMAISQGFAPHFGHCAYEVVDADAVGMGQRFLEERGWRHAWGLGRHVLGSQLFDYWNDPWGAKHEHYSDGDRFTNEQPMGVHAVSRRAMSQWGPIMPKSFFAPKLTASNLVAIAKTLSPGSPVKPRTLVAMLKAMG